MLYMCITYYNSTAVALMQQSLPPLSSRPPAQDMHRPLPLCASLDDTGLAA